MIGVLVQSRLPLPLVRRGKVREVYAVDDATLLLVASDRVSAFDVVLNEPVPDKGAVLTQLSAFWFARLAGVMPHHCLTADAGEIVARVPALAAHRAQLAGRAMLARRATPVPFECVVRGYLSGSAWAEYRRSGTLAGEPLPAGLGESQRLDPPIFSPATKAEQGHDENVTLDHVARVLGRASAERLRSASLDLYEAGRAYAAQRGIIIADTKFEFGTAADGTLLVIDEILTPRQAAVARLPGRVEAARCLERRSAAAPAAGRGGRGDQRAVSGCVRAADGKPVGRRRVNSQAKAWARRDVVLKDSDWPSPPFRVGIP